MTSTSTPRVAAHRRRANRQGRCHARRPQYRAPAGTGGSEGTRPQLGRLPIDHPAVSAFEQTGHRADVTE
jgi:hypothetical protein